MLNRIKNLFANRLTPVVERLELREAELTGELNDLEDLLQNEAAELRLLLAENVDLREMLSEAMILDEQSPICDPGGACEVCARRRALRAKVSQWVETRAERRSKAVEGWEIVEDLAKINPTFVASGFGYKLPGLVRRARKVVEESQR